MPFSPVILLFAAIVLPNRTLGAGPVIQTTGFENDQVGRTPDYVFRATGFADSASVRAGTTDFPAHSGANMLFADGNIYYIYPPQRDAAGAFQPFSSISFWYYIPNPHSDTGTASFAVMDANRESLAGGGVEVTQFDTWHYLSVSKPNPWGPVTIGGSALIGGGGQTIRWAIDDVTFVISEPSISLLFGTGCILMVVFRRNRIA